MAEDIRYSSRLDNKRKFDDQGGATSPSSTTSSSGRRTTGFSAPIISPTSAVAALSTYNNVPPPPDGIELAKKRAQEIAARLFSAAEAKRPRIESDGGADDWSNKGFSSDQSPKPMGQSIAFQLGGTNSTSSSHGFSGASKKIEIPNGRVGVIIGRSGETIKYLQVQSGARIQITRDVDADPSSQTRSVEIFGTPEQISKAEQLVNEVISEAEVGGSGSVSARNFTPFPTNAEHFSMKVPNNKVGLLIGKGGENIKNMQATCGARIQVIPLHLLPGDPSIERTVHIDGTKEQIELAKQLVNDVISSEIRARNPQTGGYRPPRPPTSWVPSGTPQLQQPSYGYMQPGAYPGPAPHYSMPQPPYAGYPPPAQQTTQATGYDYYSHQQPPPPPPEGSNINYNQMPTAYNGQATYGEATYSQSAVGYQQSYGQQQAADYNQAGALAGYGQPVSNAPPAGYAHQSYSPAPAYGNAAPSAQDGANPNHGVEGSTQQAPLGQQPTTLSQPGYAASQPPASQAGYAQPAYGHSGQGYGQDARQLVYVSGAPQAGFGQQQSYAGAPAGTATTSVEPAAINGVTKASHQS